MQIPCLKSTIIGLLLLCTTLLSGCGVLRIAYGQAPDVTYWWLDGHVDFSEPQAERARTDLAEFFAWHRQTQLPDYAQLLSRAQAQVLAAEPITPAQVCRWYDDISARTAPLVDRALPAVAATVPTLQAWQLQHLQRKFDKLNATLRDDYLQPDPADRLDAAVERVVDRTETLYGRLDAAQEARIRKLVAASPFDPVVWIAERQARQRDLLATLRSLLSERATADQAQAAFRVLIAHAQRSPREPYRLYAERLLAYNCMVGAQVHNAMSREQKQTAADRLRGWEDDLRALAADAPGVTPTRTR